MEEYGSIENAKAFAASSELKTAMAKAAWPAHRRFTP
jgi:hypothetical protein